MMAARKTEKLSPPVSSETLESHTADTTLTDGVSSPNSDQETGTRTPQCPEGENTWFASDIPCDQDDVIDWWVIWTYDSVGNRLTETTEQLNHDSAVMGSRVTYDYSCQ